MKITVNIETTDPADLIRVANALAGVMPDPAQPAPDRAPTSRRTTKTESPAAAPATVQSSVPADTPAASAPTSAPTSAAGPTATTAASPSDAVPVAEADLVAAANAAVEKIGPSGPAKIREWIAANFRKEDGSAGTLKTTRPDQRAALLKGLQEIGQGVKAI